MFVLAFDLHFRGNVGPQLHQANAYAFWSPSALKMRGAIMMTLISCSAAGWGEENRAPWDKHEGNEAWGDHRQQGRSPQQSDLPQQSASNHWAQQTPAKDSQQSDWSQAVIPP